MSKLGLPKLANVLLVDDSEENLHLLQSSLKSMNINTILASSGAEALEKQKGMEIAVAIIDLRMPVMDGFELATRLNSRRRKARIPIIFLTASQSLEKKIYEGYSVGAVDYLIKPFDLKILRYKISTLIELHDERQAVTESANQLRKTTKKLLNINLKLKKNEQKFRSYIDNSPDGVFITDEYGRYLEVNKAACRITGYSKRSILKMTIRDFLIEESLAEGLLHFSKLQTTGKSSTDIQFKHKNGTIRWWTVDAVKLSETRYLGFTKDITIRKNALLSLAESEEQYRTLFNSIVEGVIIFSAEGQITHTNPAALKILGRPVQEIIRMHYDDPGWQTIRPDRTPMPTEELAVTKAINELVPVRDIVMGVRRPDKFISWINVNAVPILSAHRELKYVVATFTDITIRTNAEEALFANETRLKKTQEIAHLGSWEFDIKSNELIWSDEVYKIFGLEPQEFTPTFDAFLDHVHPDDREMVNREYFSSIENRMHEYQVDHRIIRKKTGEIRYVNQKCEHITDSNGRIVRSLGMIHDITRRKTIEEALKKNEEQFRSLVYNSSELMLLMDLEGITIYISPQCQQITGYPESKFLNKKMPEIIHPEDVTQVQKSWETIVYKGENLYNLEYRIIDNESKVRWLSHTATVVRTDDKVIGIQSIIRDITSPKMAEQALKVSEEKYRTMLNASPDGILITNLKGIITEVSEIGLQLFGTNNPGDLIGKHFLRFVPPEEKGTVKEIIEKTMNEGLSQNIEIMARKKHLGLFLCETSSTLIQGPDGAPFSFMIIIRDISSRKKLEKKQIHADRMASLGEMASGIAHEINQPLNTISFVVDNIIMELSNLSNDQKSYINRKTDKIFDNISRIRNIIDHVRAFSRSHDDFILSSFKINDSIKNAVSLISEQFRHLGINLQLILERDIPDLIGNTFKFEQVILNMLSNAKDALLEKANILSAPYEMKMSIKSFYENQNVIVEITDNGTGINDEDIEHITLPFYTTKDSDKGTGLGLSISYQIIREMHGSIEISSKIFEGTTFKIILNYQENKPV